jgi:predicted acylesterase/phospholipase RssA
VRHTTPEFSVFLRKARQAAHQALFFLYELEPVEQMLATDGGLASDVAFARNQVRVLLEAVRLPADTPPAPGVPPANEMAEGPVAYLFEHDGTPAELFQIHDDFVSEDVPRVGSASSRIAGFWAAHVVGPLRVATWTSCDLVIQLRAFLQITRPVGFEYVSHLTDRSWLLARRNMAFLLGLCGAVGAFAGVEQLRSLLVNNPRGYLALAVVGAGGMFNQLFWWWPLKALQLLASAAPAPIATPLRRVLDRHAPALRRLTLKLRLGKRAFFRVAAHATTPERGVLPWPETGRVRRLIGRWEMCRGLLMAIYLVVTYAVCLTLVDARSCETLRTVYPIAALFLMGVNALHWVDLWEFIDRRPIRILGLWLFGLFLFGSLVLNRHLLFATGIPLVLFGIWLWHVVSRRHVTEAGLCAAALCLFLAGGAYFGTRTAERDVWRAARTGEPELPRIDAARFPFPGAGPVVLMAASGGGSRAAVYTAMTLDALHNDPELRPIGASIQAVSSVSGGSLATAAYIAERIRRNERAAAGTPDGSRWNTQAMVRLNFLTPTLKGALLPGVSRGDAIEQYWNEHVGLGGRSLGDLAKAWEAARETGSAGVPFPLPLFNSCALDGHAVVISPLKFDVYSKDNRESRRKRLADLQKMYGLPNLDNLTWVVDRDAIYGLDEWNALLNPTLAQSVRASANFPFGFPLVEVDTPLDYAQPYERGNDRIRLTDGGVLSNSGVWSLYHLMMTRDEVRKELKKRGVLMLIVDASRMPEYKANRNELSTLFGAIGDHAPIAQNLHRKMFDLLAREFGERVEVVQVDLPPTVYDNVQTTWALDDKSLDKLTCNFETLWGGTTATGRAECEKIRGAGRPGAEGHLVGAAFRRRLVESWGRLTREGSAPTREETKGSEVAERLRTFEMLRVPLD